MMKRITKGVLAAGVASLLPGPLAAQEASAPQPDALHEAYSDWVVRCESQLAADGATAQQICDMSQELTHTESGQRVLSMALQTLEDGTAALTLITPFGLRLSEGIRVDLGEESMGAIPFRTCLPRGCLATTELDESALALLGAGEAAQMVMVTDAGQELSVGISLIGFSAAWARLGTLPNDG